MLGDITFILIGFVLLVGGADRLVLGAGASARNLGISPLLIGLTIVAFATSAPEIIVSAVSAAQGSAGLAIGNALGFQHRECRSGVGRCRTGATDGGQIGHAEPRDARTAGRDAARADVVPGSRYLGRIDGIVLLGGLGLLLYWIVTLGIKDRGWGSHPRGV